MDYKKKYEEALERARQFSEHPLQEDSGSIVEYIFPELAESEDEKIRNWLIGYFHQYKEDGMEKYANGLKVESIIAWLEKQGDKPQGKSALEAINEEKVDNANKVEPKDYSSIDPHFFKTVNKVEQKPNYCHHEVDLSNCSEEYRKAYYDGWNNCNMQHSQCKSRESDVLKCLINGMKFYYDDNEEATWGTEKFSMKVKDILSWLEKQGEKLPVGFYYVNSEGKKFYSDTFKYGDVILHVEKQDKQKPYGQREECLDCQVNYAGECKGSCELKRNEQKPIINGILIATNYDKMFQNCNVHKFNVGDWIIFNGITLYIEDIVHGYYKTISVNGISQSYEWNIDKFSRLWAIQDTNDGDVLAFKNNIGGIIICKSPTDYDTGSYCRFVSDNFINKEESGWDSTLLVPATKEQRDFLFQTITEAGYKWDANKLELKKIDMRELVKQKPAWGEEDEHRIKDTIYFLDTAKKHYASTEELDACIDWLKSIKQRMGEQ